jgi:hypothetical protein
MLAAVLATAAGCSNEASSEPPTPAGECLLLRDNPSGVIGMDVGSSVSLGGGKSRFLFGDTFLGVFDADGSRNIHGAVHSSTVVVDDAAVGTCFAGSAFETSAGSVAQLLAPTQDMAWPLGPARVDGGTLELTYTWVQSDTNDPLGFRTLGNGIVYGPASAASLPVDVRALSAPVNDGMPAAWIVRDDYAYLYRCGSQLGAGWDPCIVGRAPVAGLTDLASYRYYVSGKGYVGAVAEASIVTEGAPAFTVTYSAYVQAYLEVYVEPFGSAIYARTASAPEGPFSNKVALWRCSLPADDPNASCYAGFEHPQLDSSDGRHIVVTYSTNTTDFGSMVRHPNLYWPRLVTVDLAAAGL